MGLLGKLNVQQHLEMEDVPENVTLLPLSLSTGPFSHLPLTTFSSERS